MNTWRKATIAAAAVLLMLTATACALKWEPPTIQEILDNSVAPKVEQGQHYITISTPTPSSEELEYILHAMLNHGYELRGAFGSGANRKVLIFIIIKKDP